MISKPKPRRAIAAIGECMIELAASRTHPGLFERRYGGDTLNTAVYLARLLAGSGVDVHYVTRLGDDPLSRWMIEGWKAEGIDCRFIETEAHRLPGLYMIDTDEKGERSFTYWRDQAPARALFSRHDDALLHQLAEIPALYTSGITLAILGETGRRALVDLMKRRKQAGGLVAFDTNFRPQLWRSREDTAQWFEAAIGASTICLPSIEDLDKIFGNAGGAEAWTERLNGMGPNEIILKTGGDAVWTLSGGRKMVIPLSKQQKPVDTTGAGDSFNAGYLAARLKGTGTEASAASAHVLASRVIQFPGAVIPRSAME